MQDPSPVNISSSVLPPFFVAAIPMVLILLSFILATAAPEFYTKFIQDPQQGEFEAVELMTFFCSFSAGVVLCGCTVRLLRERGRIDPGVFVIGLAAMGSLFLAGEEINWGQTWMNWGVPAAVVGKGPLNLHNRDVFNLVENGGTAALLVLFFWVPVLWHTRWAKHLPESLAPAISESSVSFVIVFGLLFEGDLLRLPFVQQILSGFFSQAPGSGWYETVRFHVNELKELIIAVGLLIYSLNRRRTLSF